MAYLGNAPVVGDSTNSFKLLDDIASFTLTFDATDTSVVSISGDTLSFTNHRFVTGQKVTYTDGGGTAIGGLTDGTSYFIIKVDQNTIKLATNASNAASSTAINLTSGAAGGSHTLKVAFDGVNTKFKATFNNGKKAKISRAGQISLSINGVIQQPQDSSSPSVGYGVEADSTIVFSTAPVATDKVFATFIGEVAASFDIEDNTIDNFTGDGSTTIFNLSKEVPSSQDVLVTLDGVTQHPSDGSTTRSYSVINQALTFVSAPADGVAIQARHIGFAGATSSAVTGFYGRTGNAALISTDDISVQNISAGIATFNTISVGGTVSIGGTLTYEDVTNIDSVGLVTARNGIVVGSGITLSKDGDVFFTGIATGNGSGLTALNASNISSGTVPTARLGSGTASSSTFLRGDSTFQTVNTDLVSDTSPQLGGDLDTNDFEILLDDNHKIKFGAGNDLTIESDGTNGLIKNHIGGSIFIRANADVRLMTNASDGGADDAVKCVNNGGIELYYDNAKKFETTTNGITVGSVTIDSGFNYIGLPDNGQLRCGAGEDLRIYHSSNVNYISGEVDGRDMYLRGRRDVYLQCGDNSSGYHTFIYADNNGTLRLHHPASDAERLRTSTSGITVTGDNSTGTLLKGVTRFCPSGTTTVKAMYDETGFSNAGHFQVKDGVAFVVGDSSRGRFYYDSSANKTFLETASGGNLDIGSTHNADVQIKTNSVNRFNFGAGGFSPLADNTYTLGTSSLRWSNIYTADLHCSNKGSSNDVDGTWGDYTIQEGESDLFLINNRSGKKYKFNLTEVS